MAIVTISRQCGSLGDELASYLASKLSCPVISRQYVLDKVFTDLDVSDIEKLNESPKYFLNHKEKLIQRLKMFTDTYSNTIILGMGSFRIFDSSDSAINVRVISSKENRINRISNQYKISLEEASSVITISDRKHKRFVSTMFDADLDLSENFDILINTDKVSIEEASNGILAMLSMIDIRNRLNSSKDLSMDHKSEVIVFKNSTEEEFAKILDMYGISWLYEPKTFPITWDSEGNITSAFSPDFYLPKFDLYLELTTMDQKYVTKKNKKLRLVKELYPETNIKIVYKKDFLELVERLKSFS